MIAHSRFKSQAAEPAARLRESVEKAVHSAFWDQAIEALSGPIPSQIDRLKLLLLDVKETISPLFPDTHSIIITLSAPVPPTASPLMSTKFILKDVLLALRTRAAPARDPVVDGILADLEAPLSPSSSPTSSMRASASTAQLALLVVNTIKSIFALAETMKSDINEFMMGSLSETELRNFIVQQAKRLEKILVLEVWEHGARQHVQELWWAWINQLEGQQVSQLRDRDKWIWRIVQSLGSTKPISCPIPTNSSNAERAPDPAVAANQLPPQFFLTAQQLLYTQNYLQALVVAASLRSLTRLPHTPDSKGSDFMDRVWALLQTEIDEEDSSAAGSKIINFADEVVRARRLVSTPDEQEETQLRVAVDRTLQYGDPVFLLLQKRLLDALARQLCEPGVDTTVSARTAPDRMQTGRGRPDKRPRLDVSESGYLAASSAISPVKGFEDPLLVSRIQEIFAKIRRYIEWVDDVWLDGLHHEP